MARATSCGFLETRKQSNCLRVSASGYLIACCAALPRVEVPSDVASEQVCQQSCADRQAQASAKNVTADKIDNRQEVERRLQRLLFASPTTACGTKQCPQLRSLPQA